MNIRVPLLIALFLSLAIAMQAQPAVSERYRKARELFQKGEIEKAIEVLDDNQLDTAYQQARAAMQRAREEEARTEEAIAGLELEISQVVESYLLKAGFYNLLLQYLRAVQATEKATRILEESKEEPDK